MGADAAGGPGGSRLRVRTVEILPGEVVLIDQLALPLQERYVTCRTWREVADRISDMTVRGAPALGVTAAGGIALRPPRPRPRVPATRAAFRAALEEVASGLLATRPTAVNLRWALDEMRRAWEAALDRRRRPGRSGGRRDDAAPARAGHPRGRHRPLPAHRRARRGPCSRPAIASSRTATPARSRRRATARRSASSVRRGTRTRTSHVWVDETRPWLQGARLTAWELQVDGIPYRLITDNMAGYVMRRGEVDAVIVGADRIAANGDTANKIGTYSVSVLAKEHGIPFYVAAPLSTVDLTIQGGDAIPIEERDHAEVTCFRGEQVAPEGATARHPAFDVTPGRQHRRHHHGGRRAAAAVRAGAGGSLRRRGVPPMSAQPPVRAYLMAAGLGTRLYPLTGLTSKPMVPILNRPVMEHLLHLLRRHGVTEIAANLHYHPDKIRSYFGDGAEFGVELRYNLEEHLLGTAGGADAFREFLCQLHVPRHER